MAGQVFLISFYTGLGNSLLKSPFLRGLLQSYPGCHILLATDSKYGPQYFYEGHPQITILPIEPQASVRNLIAALRLLSRYQLDCIFLPFDSTSELFRRFFLFFRSKKYVFHYDTHITFAQKLAFSALSLYTPVSLVHTPYMMHETQINLQLLYEYNKSIPWIDSSLEFISPQICRNLTHTDRSPYIILQPSASNGQPTPKTWHPQNFLKLIERLTADFPKFSIVLVGDIGDLNVLPLALTNHHSVHNLIGRTTLDELLSLVASANAVVSHDSSIMHIADALRTPVVALYGPTDIHRTRPNAPTSITLVSQIPDTVGIMRTSLFSEADLARIYPNHYALSKISVEAVFRQLSSILSS